MNVLIDGVMYVPQHTADKGGKVKSLAQLFCEACKHEGLTIHELARKAGIKVNQAQRADYGEISLQTAVTLSDFYGIPVNQIFRAARRNATNATVRKEIGK